MRRGQGQVSKDSQGILQLSPLAGVQTRGGLHQSRQALAGGWDQWQRDSTRRLEPAWKHPKRRPIPPDVKRRMQGCAMAGEHQSQALPHRLAAGAQFVANGALHLAACAAVPGTSKDVQDPHGTVGAGGEGQGVECGGKAHGTPHHHLHRL